MSSHFERRGVLAGIAAFGVGSPAIARSPAAPAPVAPPPLRLGIASRHLQWTSIEEAVDIAREIGFDAIEWSVRPGAHVPPDQASQRLPQAIERTRRAGLAVDMLALNALDGTDEAIESVVAIAAANGVRLYRGAAAYRWAATPDRTVQLDAVKRRVATVAAMNARHGATCAYHTYSGAGMIGGNLWDLWTVFRDFDPRQIGFNYDLGHVVASCGNGWRDALAIAAPYVRAVSVKDFVWRNGDKGWAPAWVPIGEGMVDAAATFGALRERGFAGPVNLQVEHHGLLGTDWGRDHLAISRAEFIDILKRDVAATRAAHAQVAATPRAGSS